MEEATGERFGRMRSVEDGGLSSWPTLKLEMRGARAAEAERLPLIARLADPARARCAAASDTLCPPNTSNKANSDLAVSAHSLCRSMGTRLLQHMAYVQ